MKLFIATWTLPFLFRPEHPDEKYYYSSQYDWPKEK
jgi:hypothetical protein